MSSLLGYSNGERKPTAADRLADAVEALIESGPHVMFLDLKTKSYKHSHTECARTMERLIHALADAKSEEAK